MDTDETGGLEVTASYVQPQTLGERMRYCARFLLFHGGMTKTEYDRVNHRLEERFVIQTRLESGDADVDPRQE